MTIPIGSSLSMTSPEALVDVEELLPYGEIPDIPSITALLHLPHRSRFWLAHLPYRSRFWLAHVPYRSRFWLAHVSYRNRFWLAHVPYRSRFWLARVPYRSYSDLPTCHTGTVTPTTNLRMRLCVSVVYSSLKVALLLLSNEGPRYTGARGGVMHSTAWLNLDDIKAG